MSKIQRQRAKAVKRTKWELLREGITAYHRVSSQGANTTTATTSTTPKPAKFTRIPTEVPTILQNWKNAGEIGESVGVACRVVNAAA